MELSLLHIVERGGSLVSQTKLTAFLYSAYEESVSSGIWEVIGALPRVSSVTWWPSSISCRARYAPMNRVPPSARRKGDSFQWISLCTGSSIYSVRVLQVLCPVLRFASPSMRMFLPEANTVTAICLCARTASCRVISNGHCFTVRLACFTRSVSNVWCMHMAVACQNWQPYGWLTKDVISEGCAHIPCKKKHSFHSRG